MQTRSGRQYISYMEREIEQQRITNEFRQWKLSINKTFYRLTSYHLDEIRDLPYYDYFVEEVSKDIVLEIAMNNIL